MNEFEKIKRENEIMRRYLNAIYTLGFDRDGFTRAEDLRNLIDGLIHYAQLGLECNTEKPMGTNEGIKYNILDEVLYYSKEKVEELSNTVELMDSEDYKDRFKAEYYQTKIRYDKLHKMLVKYEAKTLEFEPTCPIGILQDQEYYMGNYLKTLEVRAEVEGIRL